MDEPVTWFCAECALEGSQGEVREHHLQSGHIFASGECLYLKDAVYTGLSNMSIGVTGYYAEDAKPTWVHANWCYVPGCSSPVLEDNELRDHVRQHVANGDLPL